ncbi:hypothetical protein NDU88_006779 [Pleurodeles waltl]|uniref:Uncharacterized protein n=1 Tax=Pleurodeles waltl TaxID=8319 RepID=A0AAV7WHC1_PLEWA|nr:hypothetical protein NDU88_006779 [Pleurodeles waltl]
MASGVASSTQQNQDTAPDSVTPGAGISDSRLHNCKILNINNWKEINQINRIIILIFFFIQINQRKLSGHVFIVSSKQ